MFIHTLECLLASAEDFIPWGYFMEGVGIEYRNLEAGEYWGIAPYYRFLGISDRCVEEGGRWHASNIEHNNIFDKDGAIHWQTYQSPEGPKLVSLLVHRLRTSTDMAPVHRSILLYGSYAGRWYVCR